MLIKEIYVPVTNLNLSLHFYKRIFEDRERMINDGIVKLYSGITLCTESKWSELYGVGKEYREKGVLGINIVFETTGFNHFLQKLSSMKDQNSIIYKPLENSNGQLQITLIDPDMNLITVRESSMEESTLAEEQEDLTLGKKNAMDCVFFQEKSSEDCVNS